MFFLIYAQSFLRQRQKRVALFLILILFLISKITTFASDRRISAGAVLALSPEDRVCFAEDIASLNNCVSQVNNGLADDIEIIKLIECSTLQEPCNIYLLPVGFNPARTISIRGSTSEAGLKRNYDPGHDDNARSKSLIRLLPVVNAFETVIISGLTLEDYADTCSHNDLAACPSTISIEANNVVIENVQVKKSPGKALRINAQQFSLKNSQIENSGDAPLVLYSFSENSNYALIENNVFVNNRGNLYYAFSGDPNKRSQIRNNLFIHNHKTALFFVCPGAPNNACSGGQLLLENGTKYLDIENNLIRDGGIENYCYDLGASGIEFQTGGISNVNIFKNQIIDNTGSAIVFNPNLEGMNNSQISIFNNLFFNNLRGDIVFYSGESATTYGVNLADNCHDLDCARPTVTLAQTITSFDPWAVSVSASNLRFGFYARLIDKNGERWGNDLPATLATDRTWLSFRLPGNTPPSGCNRDSSCDIQIQLYDPITGLISEGYNLSLPQSNVSPSDNPPAVFSYDLPTNLPLIYNPYLNLFYDPWAVSVNIKNIQAPPLIYLYKNLNLWHKDLPATLATDRTWLSFRLPESTLPSGCQGPDCEVTVRVLDMSNFSCHFSNSLPLSFPPPEPLINQAGVSQDYQPWAVWVLGDNLDKVVQVDIIDDSQFWASQWATLSADKTFISFNLPADVPPSECNRGQTCEIQIQLKDSYNQKSPLFDLTLPAIYE